MLTVFCDDGSTSIKLAYFDENKNLQTIVKDNGFISGWSNSFTGEAFNYTIDGEKYSYSPYNEDIIKTTNINYQYRPVNALGIQQALQSSGLTPQAIHLIVTLPISEYYTSDNQVNDVNVQRKIDNVKRTLQLQGKDVFTYESVKVYPESIPAVAPYLTEETVTDRDMTLVVDLGGTTLDCGLVRGCFESVVKTSGVPSIGTGAIIKAVQQQLIASGTPSNYNDTDKLIRDMLAGKEWKQYINDPSQTASVETALHTAIKHTANQIIEHIEENYPQFHRLYLTGGGAELIYPALAQRWSTLNDRVKKLDEPQQALVMALSQIAS